MKGSVERGSVAENVERENVTEIVELAIPSAAFAGAGAGVAGALVKATPAGAGVIGALVKATSTGAGASGTAQANEQARIRGEKVTVG